MKLTLIAAALLFVGGCTVTTTSDHTIVYGVSEIVAGGYCSPVEGPVSLPSGATNDFTVSDLDGTDDMDVTIVDDAFGCDFVDGYGQHFGVANVSFGTTEPVISGLYDFVVRCNNPAGIDCIFDLTWTANY